MQNKTYVDFLSLGRGGVFLCCAEGDAFAGIKNFLGRRNQPCVGDFTGTGAQRGLHRRDRTVIMRKIDDLALDGDNFVAILNAGDCLKAVECNALPRNRQRQAEESKERTTARHGLRHFLMQE